ncbi:GL19297 [Drosophila persimilis]|uniref:GL19297 n=1 Tax=Drosophila persimilis TaxID=7234 RepID=B4G8H3_DROPE|nr:GL19297 [Drosophila persimilis]
MQAKDIPLSTPHQYGGLPVPDKWGREIGGELLAKTRTRSDRCSVEHGTDSTSTGSSRNELCSIVRAELCALVRNEIEIQSVFDELSDTVICHVKDFLCGLSTTDNVPPGEYMEESVSTKAPKNSAIDDDVLDTKRQTQKKASPIKGILKAQKVQMPQTPGLDRKNVGELQSVSRLYKSMEYVPKKVSLQNPTQRTYQDLTKEKTQKSYRQASQHSHRTSKLKAQKNPEQKHPNQQIADFPPFSRYGDTPEDDSEECNFGVDKKARNKFMECYGKGFPKHKPKHRQSGAGHGVFSMASSNSVSTSISAKSGDELRAIVWDEMQLQSVRGDQTSRPRYKDLEEKVSTRSDLNPPRDHTHPCSNVSKFQDMKETMSTHIGSLSNLAIAVHVPTTDSFKGSTTDEMPQIECSMSVADLVRYKAITPMIMKIHKRYMTHMQNEMHLLKYLETVPRLVGQIYKDNITMEQRKL